MGLYRVIWDYLEYLGFHRVTWDYLGLSRFKQDYMRLSRII